MNELKKLNALIGRNIRIYFKDKSLFFVSLITPMILIVLFITFLGNVYKSSLISFIPEGIELPSKLINGFTSGWLFSSILATSSVTVAFCSNVMVNDKTNKTINDFNITPVRKVTIQLSYFLSNFLTTLIICYATFVLGLIYLAIVGFYLTLGDVLMLILMIILNTLFGTLLASIIEMFINTQGALSAVCTLVSSMYGFICGAYMPISQFSSAIRAFVGFLPGTYSTVLFRKYYMSGTLNELSNYIPAEYTSEIQSSFDATITMFGKTVPTWACFVIIISSILVLFGLHILLTYLKHFKKKNKKENA